MYEYGLVLSEIIWHGWFTEDRQTDRWGTKSVSTGNLNTQISKCDYNIFVTYGRSGEKIETEWTEFSDKQLLFVCLEHILLEGVRCQNLNNCISIVAEWFGRVLIFLLYFCPITNIEPTITEALQNCLNTQ